MRELISAVLLMCSVSICMADVASEVAACKSEPDSLRRLTCFDAIAVAPSNSTDKPAAAATSSAPIKMTKVALRVQSQDYGKSVYNPRVEVQPTFKNETEKTVVAIEHTMVIIDAFGEKIIDSTSRLDIKILPGKTKQSETFYYWEDNQFITNEPYDRMFGPINTGVARAEMSVTKVIFSDGTAESYK